MQSFINEILEADRRVPRKQQHTAYRIYVRIDQELSHKVAESTVRRYVRERKRQMGLSSNGEIFIPQSYQWGEEGQVDWYEAWVLIGEERQKVQIFPVAAWQAEAPFIEPIREQHSKHSWKRMKQPSRILAGSSES